MKKKVSFGLISLIILWILTFSSLAVIGPVDTSKIYISYVDFQTSDINFDGQANENGFFNFVVTTDDGSKINVALRHNSDNFHAVLTTTVNGWLAIGWQNKKPSDTSGAGPMSGANILRGGANTAVDETGGYAFHTPDNTNNIINYTSKVDSSGAKFEFLFPLASTDSADQPLAVKEYGFFIFAIGTGAGLENNHGGAQRAVYVPDIYVESSSKEGYKAPSGGSAPFGGLEIIVASLGFSAILIKLKKRT